MSPDDTQPCAAPVVELDPCELVTAADTLWYIVEPAPGAPPIKPFVWEDK
jgi:hypothetical protein